MVDVLTSFANKEISPKRSGRLETEESAFGRLAFPESHCFDGRKGGLEATLQNRQGDSLLLPRALQNSEVSLNIKWEWATHSRSRIEAIVLVPRVNVYHLY